jgi:hypothetical protein
MVAPALKIMFEDVYREQSEKMFGKDYITEVDFGQDNVRNTRGSMHKVHSTPSGSNGSN